MQQVSIQELNILVLIRKLNINVPVRLLLRYQIKLLGDTDFFIIALGMMYLIREQIFPRN